MHFCCPAFFHCFQVIWRSAPCSFVFEILATRFTWSSPFEIHNCKEKWSDDVVMIFSTWTSLNSCVKRPLATALSNRTRVLSPPRCLLVDGDSECETADPEHILYKTFASGVENEHHQWLVWQSTAKKVSGPKSTYATHLQGAGSSHQLLQSHNNNTIHAWVCTRRSQECNARYFFFSTQFPG